jgi:hypothetical protein
MSSDKEGFSDGHDIHKSDVADDQDVNRPSDSGNHHDDDGGNVSMDQVKRYVDEGNAHILSQFDMLKNLILQNQTQSSRPSRGFLQDQTSNVYTVASPANQGQRGYIPATVTAPERERSESHLSAMPSLSVTAPKGVMDEGHLANRASFFQRDVSQRPVSPSLSLHAGKEFDDQDHDEDSQREGDGGLFGRSGRVSPKERDTCSSPSRSVADSADQGIRESDYIPSDEWNDVLASVAKELGCPDAVPNVQEENKSYIASASMSAKRSNAIRLPLEGLCKDAFDKLAAKPNRRIPLYKLQTERDYAVQEEDYRKYLRTPRIDKAAEARIRNDSHVKGKSCYFREVDRRNDNEFFDMDRSARVGLASSSHLALLLAFLDKSLRANYEVDAPLLNSLGYAINAAVASHDQFARIALRSVVARRKIAISNMKLPQGQLKQELLDTPLHGEELFGGKFAEKTHEQAQLNLDIKATCDKESDFKGQKRPAAKGNENPRPVKKQHTNSNQGGGKSFQRPKNPMPSGQSFPGGRPSTSSAPPMFPKRFNAKSFGGRPFRK